MAKQANKTNQKPAGEGEEDREKIKVTVSSV